MNLPKKTIMRPMGSLFRALLVSAFLVSTVAFGVGSTAPAAGAATPEGVPVMGPSQLNATQLTNWYSATGRTPAIPVSMLQLARYYIAEGRAEGVRGDIAFAQSVVETGYFGFVGSIVKPENYNYAGMGACDSCNSGRQFPTSQVGIRAQIQHLKNFADAGSRAILLAHPPVVEWYGRRSNGVLDPALAIYNFDTFFAKGTAPTWNQMGGPGKWASAPSYATTILQVYNRILTFNGKPGGCPADRIGFGLNEARECPLPIRMAGRAVSGGNAGYYVLNGNGAVTAVGVPFFGNDLFPWDIARDIQVTPDGQGYVVLDGLGAVHLFGSAATGPLRNVAPTYFGFDIARSIVLTGDGAGYFVLDGFGGVHASGSARVPAGNYPYWPGWDVGRSLAGTPDGRGLVILDGYGGVWPTGTVARLPADYFGFDIGRDIVVTPAGDGYAVLDGYGGIHRSGNVPATQDVGYAPFDRWRGFVIRNGRYTVVRNDAYRVT